MNSKNSFSFLSFFDNCENQYQVKRKLLSFKENDFCNKTHYLYYTLYVKPKISLIGKKYTCVYKRYWHNYEYEFYHSAIVIVSDKYLIIEFIKNVKGGYGHEIKNSYIIGYDVNNKLFVNKISQASYLLDNKELINKFPDVEIHKTSYNEIKTKMFGYQYDLDSLSEITISSKGNYRIQGEICIYAEDLDDNTIDFIYNNLSYEITRHLDLLLIDFIAIALIDIGFNISITQDDAIVIDEIIKHDDDEKMEKKLKALMQKVKEKLVEHGIKLVEEKEHKQTFYNGYYGNFALEYRIIRLGYNRKYHNVGIIPYSIRTYPGKLSEILQNEIKESLNNLQKKDFNFVIGNHFINVKNAISLRLRVMPKTQPLLLNPNSLNLNARNYYVDDKSEITITHNEHGIAKIKFTKPFIINIRTTSINEEQALEINRVVMYSIYNNKNNNNNKNNKTLDFFI